MAAAYTPLCPIHSRAMVASGSPENMVFFRCPEKGCDKKKQVPKVEFVPASNFRNRSSL